VQFSLPHTCQQFFLILYWDLKTINGIQFFYNDPLLKAAHFTPPHGLPSLSVRFQEGIQYPLGSWEKYSLLPVPEFSFHTSNSTGKE
jgi:hypothetical protein